jgi:CDP-diacylglycerol--glycerol-3-phosphate 3-phosphatidyltransferase
VAGPGAAPGLLVVPLPQEQEQLYRRAGVVSSATFEQPSRQVKLWVKMVTPLIKNFF